MYSSLNRNSKEARPCKIKTYAIFKQLGEFPKSSENLVIAADSTNEVVVSFNQQSNCKVFTFDKVYFNDVSQVELYTSILKSVVPDVMMGFNCFLIVFRLPTSSDAKPLEVTTPGFKMDLIQSVVANALKDLLVIIKNEETIDSSLHASYFEVHGDKVLDLLNNSIECKNLKILETADQQNWIEIKDLTEKPLVEEDDIHKLLSNVSPCGYKSSPSCYHSILSSTVVKKTLHTDGFECLKTGKLTVVDFAECKNNILLEEIVKTFATGATSGKYELKPFSCGSKLIDFLKPAFGGNAKTILITTLSSVLDSPEEDLSSLQFVSQSQKIVNYPEINERLIIPNSLKEYSEEIQELKKEYDTISSCSGFLHDNLLYRYYKMSLAAENEKLKDLKNYLLSLTVAVNSKNCSVTSLRSSIESLEYELKGEEEETKKIQLEIDRLKDDKSIRQKLSGKVEETIAIKNLRHECQVERRKLKYELSKAQRTYSESVMNTQALNKCLIDLSKDVEAEQSLLMNNLNSLRSKMSKVSSDFNCLKNDLFKKLNELPSFEGMLKTWNESIKDLLSQFSLFVEKQSRGLNLINQQVTSTLSLQKLQNDILGIIQNNRDEGARILSFYFHKIQAFSDSSIQALRGMAYELEVIQNIYKAEMKSIETALSSLSEGFKQFTSEFNNSLKLTLLYFQEQESKLALMTNFVSYQHEFKKHFDDKIEGIKNALCSLKEMCSSHFEASFSKWNEIKRDFVESTEKHGDVDKIMQNCFLIHKETLKYCDNLTQLHSNAAKQSTLKDKTENVENRLNQLLQMHEESYTVIRDAASTCNKITEKELMERNKYFSSEKSEIEKDLKDKCLMLEINSRSFNNDIRNIQHGFSCYREVMKKNFDALLSTNSYLVTAYNNCVSTSNGVLGKTAELPKIIPKPCSSSYDTLPRLEISFDESKFYSTSTPSKQLISGSSLHAKIEKRVVSLSAQKANLLQQVKSVVLQQMMKEEMPEKTLSEKSDSSDSESERTLKKGENISTMSLPNLNSHIMTNLGARKKIFPKFKTHKK